MCYQFVPHNLHIARVAVILYTYNWRLNIFCLSLSASFKFREEWITTNTGIYAESQIVLSNEADLVMWKKLVDLLVGPEQLGVTKFVRI